MNVNNEMKRGNQQRLVVWVTVALLMANISLVSAVELSAKHTLSSYSVTLPIQWTLTGTKGRPIEVDILSATDKDVKLKSRSGGEEYLVPLGCLCRRDQKFIKDLLPLLASGFSTKSSKTKEKRDADLPTDPSLEPELPQRLLNNIPPLEDQLTELTLIADQLIEEGRDRIANHLIKWIEHARGGDLDALIGLSFAIHEMKHLGFPDGAKRSFNVLRIPLSEEHPEAFNQIIIRIAHRNGIPDDFREEVFLLIKKKAEQGHCGAMHALGVVLINNHSRPKHVRQDPLAGCRWLEKAIVGESSNTSNATLGKGYKYSGQFKKAIPILTATANAGNPYNMAHLADLYYDGHGCERDVVKAVSLYEKAAAEGVDYGRLAVAKNSLKYERDTLNSTFGNADFTLKILGLEGSKKAVIIFDSPECSSYCLYSQLSEFENLFKDGWSIIEVSYPNIDLFSNAGRVANVWRSSSAKFEEGHFKGFGEAVFTPIKKSGRFDRIVLLGNSLGAGAIAWDLEKIQKHQNVSSLWISPTEVFLPKVANLKALKDVTIIANQEGDPFVRSPQLKKLLQSNSISANAFGELPKGHLILGQNLPWKRLVDYLIAYGE